MVTGRAGSAGTSTSSARGRRPRPRRRAAGCRSAGRGGAGAGRPRAGCGGLRSSAAARRGRPPASSGGCGPGDAPGSRTAETGASGHTPCRKQLSASQIVPMPATTVWSRSASPSTRSGSAVRRAHGLCRVVAGPRAEQVGAEVTDHGVLLRASGPARRGPAAGRRPWPAGGQHDPGVRRRAGPTRPGGHHPPAALHLEVGVQGQRRAGGREAGEQMLAVGGGAEHHGAGEVDGREGRHAEVGRGEPMAGRARSSRSRGTANRIALRHGSAAPQAARGRTKPAAASASRSGLAAAEQCARRRPSRR